MRFKDCELVCYNKVWGARVLLREPFDEYFCVGPTRVNHQGVYLVQKHFKFLGIGYWKTIYKSRSCNPNAYRDAMDYYDLITWGRQRGLEK